MYRSYKGKKFTDRKILSEMVRNIHSIEKGMCLSTPRMGYGLKKIYYLMQITDQYINSGYDTSRTELKMVCGALQSYVKFHKESNYYNEEIKRIEEYGNRVAHNLGTQTDFSAYGGVIDISYSSITSTSHTLEQAILLRHSVREFSSAEVNDSLIYEAVRLANHCPSACNRQTTKVYIVDKSKVKEIQDWLSGIGGFANDANKFLIITGRTSAFNTGEVYQYIVSAGIFTGFLSLCLNEKGIGNCVIQRPLLCSPTWQKFAKANAIPEDEQIVCMIAVGIPKETTKVPISYRLSAKELVRKL